MQCIEANVFMIVWAGALSLVGRGLPSILESLSFIAALHKMSMVLCRCNASLLRRLAWDICLKATTRKTATKQLCV